MNQLQHLLVKLAEEGAEVAQISLKAAQFGAEEVMAGQPFTNFQRCHQELDDLQAIVEMLNAQYGFAYSPNRERLEAKKAKVRKYLGYSIRLGLVDGDQPVSSEVGIPTSQPIGYMHTLDNTDGIPGNEPMCEFSRSAENPFGEPGVDYSPEYQWTVRPIYITPQPDRVAELECRLRESEARAERLRKLSVTEILLEVVPGDGEGLEIYAQAVEQVEAKLSSQGLEIERLTAEVEQLRGGLEYARDYVDSLVENGETVHAAGLLRDIDGFLSGKEAQS